MALIKEQGWCVPCILNKTPNRSGTTIQHVVKAGKRLGQDWVYGCCEWHHLGQHPDRNTKQQMLRLFGPSLAQSRREYRAQYGEETDLVMLQDYIIRLFERSPWRQYNMPRHVAHDIQREWFRIQGML